MFSTLFFMHRSPRSNGLVQGYSNPEGSPPSVHGMLPGYARSMSKPLHHGQNSPSRLGQQSSQAFQQQFQQYRPPSVLNPDQQLLPNVLGQHIIHQSSNVGHNQISNGGNNSVYALSYAQKDNRADYTQIPGIGSSLSTGAHSYTNYPQDHVLENNSSWLSGMPRAQPQSTNEISWGQRAGHTFTTFPPSIHGRRDYRRIG